MKKKSFAIAMVFAMTVTSVPFGSVNVSAEDFQDGFTSEEVNSGEEDFFGGEFVPEEESELAETAEPDVFLDETKENPGNEGTVVIDKERTQEYTIVKKGTGCTLQVFTEGDRENLNYSWYWVNPETEQLELMEEGRSALYNTGGINTISHYICYVDDGITTDSFYFTVTVAFELDESRIENQIAAKPNETKTLKVYTTEEGDFLEYTWYKWNKNTEAWSLLEEKSDSLTLENITEDANYLCCVGNRCPQGNKYASFEVELERPEVRIDRDRTVSKVSAKPGETVRLQVYTVGDLENLEYAWYFWNTDAEEWNLLEENSASLQVPAGEKNSMYYCRVGDGKTDDDVTFYVGQFSYEIDEERIQHEIYVGEDGIANLQVYTKEENSNISYTWYRRDFAAGEWEMLEEKSSVLALKNVKESRVYTCLVQLGEQEEWIDFKVYSENDRVVIDEERTKTEVVVKPKEKATLHVYTEGDRENLIYTWYKYLPEKDEYELLTDGNSPELTVDSEEQDVWYLCNVGNGIWITDVSFNVRWDECIHRWGEGTVTKTPGCAAAGEKQYICKNCGEKKTETIPATGKHTWKAVVDKAATCGAAGSQHKECSVCGKKDAATAIPATGNHSFGEYTVTKAPTVLAAGVKTRTCKVCGKTETAAVAKLNGTIKVVSAKVPLQLKKKVALSKLVTGFTTGDSINAAACTSSKPSIAAISGGNVVAKKAGTTVITVKLASGASAQVTVVVQKKAVATSSITVPSTVNLTTGEKLKLTPVVSPVTSLNKVSYTSTNKKVATVTKNGVITAKKSGTATIKVKAGKKTKNVKVKVAKKAPTGMTGVPATKTLKKGKSFTIKAKLTPSGAEATIKYSSSNKKIATVNSKGKVTAKKAGTVTITVKAGNVTKTCVVTVKK